MRNSIALAVGALLAFPVAAAAQEAVQQTAVDCLCVLPAEAGPGVAAVQDVRGQVLLSDSVGYTPIQSSAELSVGDRVILLSDGQAALAAGPTCQVTLAADSIINLLPTEAGVCVAHASTAQEHASTTQEHATVIQPTADLPPPVLDAPVTVPPQPVFDVVPVLVGTAVIGGIVACIALCGDDDRPFSPGGRARR